MACHRGSADHHPFPHIHASTILPHCCQFYFYFPRALPLPGSHIYFSRSFCSMQLCWTAAQPGIQATRAPHSLPVCRPIGSSSSTSSHYCTHPQLHRRRPLLVVGSSSDDILKKYGISPAGDVSGCSTGSSSNKPAPVPKPQTSGASMRTCMHRRLQQCLPACISPQ